MKPEDRGPEIVSIPGGGMVPVRRDTNIEQIAAEKLESVALDQYDGDDPDYEGKTRLEAAVLSLAQDSATSPQARTEFLDRIMGKPKLKTESVVTTLNLNDYLTQLAAEEDAESTPIDITPEETAEDGDEDESADYFT